MRIVIDLLSAQTDKTYLGMGRHTVSMVREFIDAAQHYEIILLLHAKFGDRIPEILNEFRDLKENQIRIFDAPVDSHLPSPLGNSANILRQIFLSRLRPDWVIITSPVPENIQGYIDSTVHGEAAWKTAVIHYELPSTKQMSERLAHKNELNFSADLPMNLRGAEIHFTFSENTGEALTSKFNINSENIFTITPSFIPSLTPGLTPNQKLAGKNLIDAESLLKKLDVPRYILYAPGTISSQKNFEGLIIAYHQLSDELKTNFKLVIACEAEIPESVKKFVHANASDTLHRNQVVLAESLGFFEIQSLYENASLVVYPSLIEDFGASILCAMGHDYPVIASNFPSYSNLLGQEMSLFDPCSIESLSDRMRKCLEDAEFSRSVVLHQKNQVKILGSNKTVEKTLEILASYQKKSAAVELQVDSQKTGDFQNPHRKILQEFIKQANRIPSLVELAYLSNSLTYNQGPSQAKQLLVDVSLIVVKDDKSGIQRVIRSLITQFIEHPPEGFDICPVYFDGKIYRYSSKFLPDDGTPKTQSSRTNNHQPVEFWQNDIFLCLDLTMHLSDLFDHLHLKMRQKGVKLFFVIYDLLPLKHAQWFADPGPEMFKAWIRKITQHADGLSCISEAVANELREWIEENPLGRRDGGPLISSFHLGADIDNSRPSAGMPDSAERLLSLFKKNKSFLMVSTLEPRKGHTQTLKAFDRLWQDGHDVLLVIVGKKGWKVDDLCHAIENHPLLNQKLFWLHGVSDEYLNQIYRSCTCLIAASEGEGFGLPLIESAHHKIPIIARDLPVFQEVAKNHAHYFSTIKSENLAQAIKDWLKLFASGSHPRSEGMPWLTWKQSADQLLKNILFK